MTKEVFFCTITDKYIDFLRETEPKDSVIMLNKSHSANDSRKYVGVLLDFGDFKYFAPLSSPKDKHRFINDKAFDVYKISGGKLGIINFNNMIPVVKGEYKEFDFNKVLDPKYKALLINQYIEIKSNIEHVIQKAKVLRTIYSENKGKEKVGEFIIRLLARCCDFPSLEKKAVAFLTTGGKNT